MKSLSRVWLFVTPRTAARPGLPVHHQLLELTQTHVHRVGDTIEHLILCWPLLLLLSIFPSIRVFSNESVLHIRWPKYWSFSFNIRTSNEYSRLFSFRIDWFDFLAVQGTLKSLFSNTTVQKHQFFSAQLYSLTLTSIHDYWKNPSLLPFFYFFLLPVFFSAPFLRR